jgi:hypothetical protein
MAKYRIERTAPTRDALCAVTLTLVSMLALSVAGSAAQAPSRRNSAATITGAFADSCRDFTARSSKDISYVELHYVAGSVIRDESINRGDHSIDGGAGEEIELAIVKSGTTVEEFGCVPANRAPTAALEIQTPPIDHTQEHCYDFFSGGLICEQSSPRTVWTSARQVPDNGGTQSGLFTWGCGALSHPSLCSLTTTFRIIGSSDPDGDITSWSLDFGDGSTASGSWTTSLPTEIVHEYARGGINCHGVVNSVPGVCVITLTVTDSAGQSDSDTIMMVFVDQTPD